MSGWGESAAVGKAWSDDKTAATGVLGGAAGLGVLRGGAEMEARARRGVTVASEELARRKGAAAAAHANADARKGKRGEPVRKPGGRGKPAATRWVQTTAEQRAWAQNLDRGVTEQARRVGAMQRVLPGQVKAARRVKAGGLGLAALGAYVGLKGARRASERRRMGY